MLIGIRAKATFGLGEIITAKVNNLKKLNSKFLYTTIVQPQHLVSDLWFKYYNQSPFPHL